MVRLIIGFLSGLLLGFVAGFTLNSLARGLSSVSEGLPNVDPEPEDWHGWFWQ